MDVVIHTIAAATWTRYDKWRVELELVGEPKRVCWLSATQYDYLASAFSHTKNGFSNARCTVIGEFDDAGHYQRCKAVAAPPKPPKPRHFTPLTPQTSEIDHDLRDHH